MSAIGAYKLALSCDVCDGERTEPISVYRENGADAIRAARALGWRIKSNKKLPKSNCGAYDGSAVCPECRGKK